MSQENIGAMRNDLPPDRRLWTTNIVAMAGLAFYAILLISLHILRSDIDPVRTLTFEYATGRYGYLMTLAFLSMAVGSTALVIGLYRGVSAAGRSRLGLGLMGLWIVGVLLAMAFPPTVLDTPGSLAAGIQRVNAPLHVLCLAAGAVLVSRGFKRDEMWRPIHSPALTLSLLMLAAFVAVAVLLATNSRFAGLGQRVFIVTFLTWFSLTVLGPQLHRGSTGASHDR